MSALITLLSLPLLSVAPVAGPPAAPAAVDSSQMTTVVVQNDRSTPVTVYAESARGDFRLGVVGAYDTETLRVPDIALIESSQVDFFIDPKRGAEQDSGYMELHHGEHVGLVVPER